MKDLLALIHDIFVQSGARGVITDTGELLAIFLPVFFIQEDTTTILADHPKECLQNRPHR
jgi:hypothetical protein